MGRGDGKAGWRADAGARERELPRLPSVLTARCWPRADERRRDPSLGCRHAKADRCADQDRCRNRGVALRSAMARRWRPAAPMGGSGCGRRIRTTWIERLCATANRDLTTEEWAEFVGDAPYEPTCPGLRLMTQLDDSHGLVIQVTAYDACDQRCPTSMTPTRSLGPRSTRRSPAYPAKNVRLTEDRAASTGRDPRLPRRSGHTALRPTRRCSCTSRDTAGGSPTGPTPASTCSRSTPCTRARNGWRRRRSRAISSPACWPRSWPAESSWCSTAAMPAGSAHPRRSGRRRHSTSGCRTAFTAS